MKKALLLLVLVASFLNQISAQVCVRDSNLLLIGDLLSPAPYSPDSPFYNLKTACINEPYQQSVTVLVPDSFSLQGNMVKITNVTLPPNAVKGLPTGLTYSCDPANCTFLPLTLGCILLYGTPTSANIPDTFTLGITAKVTISLSGIPFTVDVTFPGDVAPGNFYYLILKNQGECVSSDSELDGPFSQVRALPNPTTGHTIIEAQSTQTGTFLFEVFDLLGKQLHSEKVLLYEGENKFTFDASSLPTGTYLYTLGNAEGKAVRRMVKN